MSDQFKVGEIAIVQNANPGPYAFLNGTECEVMLVRDEPYLMGGIDHKYVILCVDGDKYNAAQLHLRRKRPPQKFEGEMRIMRLFNQAPAKTLAEEVPA